MLKWTTRCSASIKSWTSKRAYLTLPGRDKSQRLPFRSPIIISLFLITLILGFFLMLLDPFLTSQAHSLAGTIETTETTETAETAETTETTETTGMTDST